MSDSEQDYLEDIEEVIDDKTETDIDDQDITEIDDDQDDEDDEDDEIDKELEAYISKLPRKVIINRTNIFPNIINHFEMVELVGQLANLLQKEQKSYIESTTKDILELAKEHLYANKCPLMIKRVINDKPIIKSFTENGISTVYAVTYIELVDPNKALKPSLK